MPQAAPPLSAQSPQGPATAPATPASPSSAAGSASVAAAPGPQPPHAAPAAPAPPTPVQIFWDVARLALGLLARLSGVLHPVQSRYPKQAWQIWHLCTDIPRILLTIRFAPERITVTQLRHLTRARHLLQALFGYTLPPTPLGARTSRPPQATAGESPSASTENATPTVRQIPTVPGVSGVPEVPEVPGVPHVAATPSAPGASQVRQSQSHSHQSAIGNLQSAISDTHTSHSSHSSHSPHSTFSPYIPDYQTLLQALKADVLPANCAGALLDDPGDALVRALQQLHAIYFSLYPQKSSSPSPSQSPSPSSGNLQSTICNPQSPSVHPVHPVHPVHDVHNVHLGHIASPSPHSTAPP